MVLFDGFFGLLMVAVWIFCIIDVITTPEDRCRNLPKLIWLLIVILFTAIGSIAWLVAGRPWEPKATADVRSNRRPARRTVPSNPDDDEEFLAGLRVRAEEQRRRAREVKPDDEPGQVG